MSSNLLETEIRRVLASNIPEVLCISGKWGIGKTYAWKKYLEDAIREGTLAYNRYSYVTLLGLNSTDDLRYSIFENTVNQTNVINGPDPSTFAALFAKSTDLGRKMRPLLEAGFSAINRRGLADVILKSSFLAVRNQLVCLDDIERAGKSLDVRDVLGLASSLKEDRGCKVVLLLNEEQMDGERRTEFDRQLEKVADAKILFELSPEEAAKIALEDSDRAHIFMRPHLAKLGINNIRVIKKTERLAQRLLEILKEHENATIEQAISTLVLGCWSVQQPNVAPPLDFIRKYDHISITLRSDQESLDADGEKWGNILANYPYSTTDEMDAIILDGAVAGYFDGSILKDKATQIQEQRRINSRDNSFSRAWKDLYHGSLAVDDDYFLNVLYQGAIENLQNTSPLNMNSAIRMLREQGRPHEANDLVEKYIATHQDEEVEFFELRNHHFSSDEIVDEVFASAFANHIVNYRDDRDPFDVLQLIGTKQGWDEKDIILMSKQTSDDFERMFEKIEGVNLRKSLSMILTIGRSQLPQSSVIQAAATEALRRIAGKSPLRAQKLRRFGIAPNDARTALEPYSNGEPTSP